MKRSPIAGLDLTVYPRALLLLLKNPAIIVVPLLMTVIGVLISRAVSPEAGSGLGGVTAGLGGWIAQLLELFGLGAACIMADAAWRRGRASFEDGWTEARRRGGDLLTAAIIFTFVLNIAQYAGQLLGSVVGLVLQAAAALFLVWIVPAAAVGGIPGGAAAGVSIERVRETPIPAVVVAIISIVVTTMVPILLMGWLDTALFPFVPGTPIVISLVGALIQAITLGYVALIITKTYTDAAFTRRW